MMVMASSRSSSSASSWSVIAAAVVTAAAFLSLGANGQQYDPLKDFCRRFSHDAAVVKDRLYINDGQLNLAGRGNKVFINDKLLWDDLNNTVLNNQPMDLPILHDGLTKGSDVPSVIGGTLWADVANGRLFQYGGEYPDNGVPDNFLLWTYDIYADSWSTRDPGVDVNRLSFGAGTVVEHLGNGYYLGGYQSEQSNINWSGPKKASNNLVEYNMVTNTWKNLSGPADLKGRAEGVLFYTAYGDKGLMVYFGGVRYDPNAENATAEAAPMDMIDVYDLGSDKWYTQNATGDVPELRRRFCGGIARAQDGSSNNIYIYGGMGFGANETGYDDVYILTIPTFTWVKVYPAKGKPRKKSEEFPHYDLTCSVVRNAQMLVIGGQFPRDPDVKNCDAQTVWGEHNLVLSRLDSNGESVYWAKYLANRTEYSVPPDIIDIVGGDGFGSASSHTPANGFDQGDLQVLFRRTITPSALVRAPTRASPASVSSSTAAPSESAPSGPFSTPGKRAAILAPTLIGGLALAAAAFFLIARYRKKKSAAGQSANGATGATGDEAGDNGGNNPPNYKVRDSNAPESVGIPTPTYPAPGGGWEAGGSGPGGYHPPPEQQRYPTGDTSGGYSAGGYSEMAMSPVELPQGPTPMPQQQLPPLPPLPQRDSEYDGGWQQPPPPLSISRNSVPQGHYPPPLSEGLAVAGRGAGGDGETGSSSGGQEMKEVRYNN